MEKTTGASVVFLILKVMWGVSHVKHVEFVGKSVCCVRTVDILKEQSIYLKNR